MRCRYLRAASLRGVWADTQDRVLAEFSRQIPPGENALLAEVDEVADEVIDGETEALGGVVRRRSAADVLAEMEAAEQAAGAAEKESRRLARENKMNERHEKYEERKAHLRAKLHIG